MKKSIIAIIAIAVIAIFTSSNISWGKDRWKSIVEADAKGYYAYLPSIFIYQDLNYGFFDAIEKEKYYSENLYYDYRSHFNEKTINKYYCGTALAELPFFIIAHATAKIFNFDADGFSKPYAIAVNISAIFYLIIGLLYVVRILQSYSVSETNIAITLLVTVFGTNLFYYTIGEPGMSHVFSFAFIAAFIFYLRQLGTNNKASTIIILGLILGVITLIRPVNLLIVTIIPFVIGKKDTLWFKQLFSTQKWSFVIGMLVYFLSISIQLIIYKIATGSFFVYSYQEEGFNFSSPHFSDILFSYKKGLFLYTPIYLIGLLGIFSFWKTSKYLFVSGSAFFIFITYIFSSWWMWYYGGSFSSRVYVEYLPFFMILMGLSLTKIPKGLFRKSYLTLLLFLVVVCQIQTYQYRRMQIHWVEMNKVKYWDTFLRVDKLL